METQIELGLYLMIDYNVTRVGDEAVVMYSTVLHITVLCGTTTGSYRAGDLT